MAYMIEAYYYSRAWSTFINVLNYLQDDDVAQRGQRGVDEGGAGRVLELRAPYFDAGQAAAAGVDRRDLVGDDAGADGGAQHWNNDREGCAGKSGKSGWRGRQAITPEQK